MDALAGLETRNKFAQSCTKYRVDRGVWQPLQGYRQELQKNPKRGELLFWAIDSVNEE